MACIAVNDRLRDTAQQLMDHDSFVVFGYGVEGFLDDMAAKCIHAEAQCITTDGIGNGNHLLWCSMLEATLYEEVAKTIDHQRVSLGDNSLDDLILLLDRANFELLLQEDGSLLVVVADDLVDDVFPVTCDTSVKQATVVQWFHWRYIGLSWRCRRLERN